MWDMNLENPLTQNLDSLFQMQMQILDSRLQMLMQNLGSWFQNMKNIFFEFLDFLENYGALPPFILLIIAVLLSIYLYINFHKINRTKKKVIIFLLGAIFFILFLFSLIIFGLWIDEYWISWEVARFSNSLVKFAISISGELITGFIVAYFAQRIIKGSVSSQEQETQFNRGQEAYDKKEYELAIIIFRELALIKGHVKSQFALGKFYDGSKEASVKAMEYNDPVKAVKYYSYAAYQGHAEAQFILAKLYMKSKDFNKAKFWFDEAMKSGRFFRLVRIKNKIRTRQGKLSKDKVADAEYNIGKIYESKEHYK